MKNLISKIGIGAGALMLSTAGMAATVTVTASNSTPNVSQQFTITIAAQGMPNTSGPTLGLLFDQTKVSYVSGAVAGAFTGGFYVPHPASPFPVTFDILAPSDPAPIPTGNFDALVLTFQAIAPGLANIRIVDDCDASAPGYISCSPTAPLAWFNADTFDSIPIASYTQANVCVGGSCGPVVPVPAAVWLMLSGLGSLAGLKRLRRR